MAGTAAEHPVGAEVAWAAPQNVLATSIAGTWFPQTQGFYGYTESRAKWTLTGRAQEEAAAWSSRSASYTDCIPVTAPLLMLYPVTSVIEIATDVVRMRVDWMASEAHHLSRRPRPSR